MVLSLPIAEIDFDEEKKTSFRTALARAADNGVQSSDVRIKKIESVSRRSSDRHLLSQSIRITAEVYSTDSSIVQSLSEHNINVELLREHLPRAQMIEAPEVVSREQGSSSSGGTLVIVLGVAVPVGLLLLSGMFIRRSRHSPEARKIDARPREDSYAEKGSMSALGPPADESTKAVSSPFDLNIDKGEEQADSRPFVGGLTAPCLQSSASARTNILDIASTTPDHAEAANSGAEAATASVTDVLLRPESQHSQDGEFSEALARNKLHARVVLSRLREEGLLDFAQASAKIGFVSPKPPKPQEIEDIVVSADHHAICSASMQSVSRTASEMHTRTPESSPPGSSMASRAPSVELPGQRMTPEPGTSLAKRRGPGKPPTLVQMAWQSRPGTVAAEGAQRVPKPTGLARTPSPHRQRAFLDGTEPITPKTSDSDPEVISL